MLRRLLAGNGERLSSEPSTTELQSFSVVKHGTAIVGTSKKVHQFVNPSRSIFLRHGVVGYGSKGSFSSRDALNDMVENQLENKRSIYLSSHATISRENKCVTVTSHNDEIPSTIRWLDSRACIAGGDWIKLWFATDALAEEWENELLAMLQFLPLPEKVMSNYRMDKNPFPLQFNEIMWAVMLRGNQTNMMDFYLNNLVDCIDGTGRIKDREDSHSCVRIFNHLYKRLQDSCGGALNTPDHAEILAYGMMRLCQSCAIERSMVLYFTVSKEAVDYVAEHGIDWTTGAHEGVRASIAAKAQFKVPSFLLQFILASVPRDPKLRTALHLILGRTEAASAAHIDWEHENTWFAAYFKDFRKGSILTHNDFMLAIQSPSWIVYRLLFDLVTKYSSAAEGAKLGEIFTCLPEDILFSTFTVEVDGTPVIGKHFLELAFKLDQVHRYHFFGTLSSRGLCSNAVWRDLMEASLRLKYARELYECAEAVMFRSKEAASRDFNKDAIKILDEAPVLILQALLNLNAIDRATAVRTIHAKDLEKDFLKFLLSFAIRLENCESRGYFGVTTIANWVNTTLSGRLDLEKEIASLLAELDMASFIARNLLLPVFDDYFPCAEGDESSSQHSDVTPRPSSKSSSYSTVERPKLRKQSSMDERSLCDKGVLGHIVLGFFSLCIWSNSNAFLELCRYFGPNGKKLFATILSAESPLRREFISIVREKTKASTMIVGLMEENKLLNDARHFEPGAMALFSYASHTTNRSLFSHILPLALKLKDYERLKERVEDMMKSLMIGTSTKRPTLDAIIAEVNKRSAQEMGRVSLEDLTVCVNNAVTALSLFSAGQVMERERMFDMLCLYLEKEHPSSWVGLFSGAHTIAIFIKYMTLEDYGKAFTAFRRLNDSDRELMSILETVERIYPAPVVSPVEVEHIMESGTSPEAVESLLSSISERGATMDSDGRFIIGVSTDWMRYMYKRINIPMAPRNSQLITMLTCVNWVKDAIRSGTTKALIGQVGTGEGKSLIIAMTAIYLVKEMGLKVHVLENNSSLLEKDFAVFRKFYEDQGCSVCARFQNEDAKITYCLRSDPEGGQDMEGIYQTGVYTGREPFDNTVLIVDEVDELIVDGEPNTSYVKNISTSGVQLKLAFDTLHAGSTTKPDEVDDEIWNTASATYRTAISKREGVDFVRSGDDVYLLDKGNIVKRTVNNWIDCLRYLADTSYNVGVRSRYFLQSMPHMMSQYKCILGLSGSLGSTSEQEFLAKIYKAKTVKTPSFLDTCKGVTKSPPVLIDNVVQVYDDYAKQTAAIIEMAVDKFQRVPVLIITKSTTESNELHSKLVAELSKSHHKAKLGGQSANDFVQIFARYSPGTTTEMPYPSIIEKATESFDTGVSTRRITVTDPFGGRGHDFALFDEEADAAGGMAVIATNIPPSERDWTQWKGRTARSDRRGQYAVILCSGDDPIKGEGMSLLPRFKMHDGHNQYSDELLRALLDLRDEETRKAIAGKDGAIMGGMRANELVDHFYRQYQREQHAPWYSGPHDRTLSKFIERYQFSTEAVEECKRSTQLSYTSRYR